MVNKNIIKIKAYFTVLFTFVNWKYRGWCYKLFFCNIYCNFSMSFGNILYFKFFINLNIIWYFLLYFYICILDIRIYYLFLFFFRLKPWDNWNEELKRKIFIMKIRVILYIWIIFCIIIWKARNVTRSRCVFIL